MTTTKTAPTIQIGLLGLGTVGGGTVTVLARNMAEITRRTGYQICIRHAAAKNYDPNLPGLACIERISTDAEEVIADPQIDIIIELIGGYSPARELVLQAIQNGKHVITANKALIAKHGNEILAAAQKHKVIVAFEASVAGGIPIIKTIREGLTANRIEYVAGIINGTGNYILSEMRKMRRNFQDVLQEAQDLGYAEADPSFDIEGTDAAHKLAILAAMAFGIPLQFKQIYTEGISAIEQQDVSYAEELGYHIKHLGIARRSLQGIELRVHPVLLQKESMLARVDGVMNAVLIKSDAVGSTMYYGAGAGAQATASAVIADLVDIIRTRKLQAEDRIPALAFQPEGLEHTDILPIEEIESAYYLRLQVLDQPGVLADITRIFAETNISIGAIMQKETSPGLAHVPVILMTKQVKEKNLNAAIAALAQLPAVKMPLIRLRIELFTEI